MQRERKTRWKREERQKDKEKEKGRKKVKKEEQKIWGNRGMTLEGMWMRSVGGHWYTTLDMVGGHE